MLEVIDTPGFPDTGGEALVDRLWRSIRELQQIDLILFVVNGRALVSKTLRHAIAEMKRTPFWNARKMALLLTAVESPLMGSVPFDDFADLIGYAEDGKRINMSRVFHIDNPFSQVGSNTATAADDARELMEIARRQQAVLNDLLLLSLSYRHLRVNRLYSSKGGCGGVTDEAELQKLFQASIQLKGPELLQQPESTNLVQVQRLPEFDYEHGKGNSVSMEAVTVVSDAFLFQE
jgi:hypothetical protein